jgi:hypothetical protein
VDVRATGRPDCPTAWFRTKPAKRKRGVLVRGKGRVTLPARGMRAPTIAMIESGTNQDSCQGARLTLMAEARSKRARVALAASSEQEGQLVGPALRVLLPVAAVLLLGARLLSDRRARRTSAAASSSGNEGRR